MNALPSLCRRGAMAACLLILSACAPEPETAGPPKYRVTLTVVELMTRVLDPAADVIWDSAGYDITAAGEEVLAPSTPEGWNQVANNAAVLMETANLLMLPGRTQPGDWIEIASGLADASMAAKLAADNQDHDALFEAGGTIYRVCLSCHQLYWAESR